jgi:signal transduction histidine kinase
MDRFQALRIQLRAYLIFVILIENLLIILGIWYAPTHLHIPLGEVAMGAYAVSIVMTFIITFAAADYALQPLRALWLTIVHIAPNERGVAAPNLKRLAVGRTLVTSLSAQIYQIASMAEQFETKEQDSERSQKLQGSFIANNLPLPLLVLSKEDDILFLNDAALKYIGQTERSEVVNKNVNSILDMSFDSEDTFDSWLTESRKNTVTATHSWERVRLEQPEHDALQFDLAAYYNKDNPENFETIMVLFDHTERYSQDDQAMSYVALAVHELRTPLTLMRGYIEMFDEELEGKLDGEMQEFMHKMNVAAQQLSAFVNNILNVARIEGDQLSVHLQEENWNDILKTAVDDLRMRAQVRGISLEYQPGTNLPKVGVDRVSIYEVISNLVDNAIKYSGQGKKIVIHTGLNTEGVVETTVQDFGVGIPESIMPNLFAKFYRSHRSRAQVGGTGLGLYLSKAIVDAHGGNIWVRSKEGQGSTFGFTVLPYTKLADAQKTGDNKDIVRGAHGWIKNHSLYRR